MTQKILNISLIFLGFAFLYGATVLSLINYSGNVSDKQFTFLGKAQAELNFFQDDLKSQNYILSGSTFWSSENHYNSTFGKARVMWSNESISLQSIGSDTQYIIRNVTRDSH